MVDELWSHVQGGAKHEVETRLFVKLLGKAQVCDFDVEILGVR